GHDTDRAAGEGERSRQQLHDRVICAVVNRRSRDAQQKPALTNAIDGGARRSGDHANLNTDASRRRRKGERRHHPCEYTRRPKIALPTRTIVAPSSTATSKSSLMPIESSDSRSEGVPPATRESRKSRSRLNHGREASGVSGIGGTIMSPRRSTARASSAAFTRSLTTAASAPN